MGVNRNDEAVPFFGGLFKAPVAQLRALNQRYKSVRKPAVSAIFIATLYVVAGLSGFHSPKPDSSSDILELGELGAAGNIGKKNGNKGETYCGMTIDKSTQTSANVTASFDWYITFLNAKCQGHEKCEVDEGDCGVIKRAALPLETDSVKGCFGLHVVNNVARSQGLIPMTNLAEMFKQSLSDFTRYVPLMDQSTMFYTPDADSYAAVFQARNEPYLVIEWYSDNGHHYYSIIGYVAATMACVEIVTENLSEMFRESVTTFHDDLVRLPESAFTVAKINRTDSNVALKALAISKATADLERVAHFYDYVIGASDIGGSSEDSRIRTFSVPGGDLSFRFIQRDDIDETGSAITVERMEYVKRNAHATSFLSHTCGMDRFYDNHYGYNMGEVNIDSDVHKIDTLGHMIARLHGNGEYHCQENGMYVWEPTGDTIYMGITAHSSYYNLATGNHNITDSLAHCLNVTDQDRSSLMCSEGSCLADTWSIVT